MKLLVSVRSIDEALLAAQAGADFIDLKEPGQGALGGLPVDTIRAIVTALRAADIGLPISATIGDVPVTEGARIADCVAAVAACGVDYVKVGIGRDERAAPGLLDALARQGAAGGTPIVPVFLADQGLDAAMVARACALGFPAIMVDTFDKQAGSLFGLLPMDELRRFVATVRAADRLAGLAGALRLAHAPLLRALAPDFAGFRTAVCSGEDRTAQLDAARLRTLAAHMRGQVAEPLLNEPLEYQP